MSRLIVHPSADRTFIDVSPGSAGWEFVGFEVISLGRENDGDMRVQRECCDREVCIVVVEGTVDVRSARGDWAGLGGRADPWAAPPDAVYLPPETGFELTGSGEVALCWAPAPRGGADARVLPSADVEIEVRGYGRQERMVLPILMADRAAESLLVCEVRTPAGNWSSYPPHKHDRDDPPRETLLEETYYHRITPAQGFGLQRVYSEDRSLDVTMSFGDRDCVLVPRGYHTVSAPPGYDLYYLNVMAGPRRQWAVVNDPDHEWRMTPPSAPQPVEEEA